MAEVEVFSVEDKEAGFDFSVAPASGGELSSVRVRRDGRWVELLHRAGRFESPGDAWRGRAPWLFPAVGRSRHDGRMGFCSLEGRVRPMPMHGFLMERAWELVSADAAAVVCRAAGDAATRELFPFDFELTAAYRLVAGGLSARVAVTAAASNAGPMPFSVGNHLTLAIPFARGADPLACEVRAPAAEIQLLSPESLLSGESSPGPDGRAAALRGDPGLGDRVLGGFAPGQVWAELRDPSAFTVRVTQRELVPPGGAPKTSPEHFRFVFYADPGRTFFCPEPWYGGPNSLNDGRGLVRLAAGERFDWEMELTIR
jgi:galactose mutarotase-like enzyme